MAKDTPAQEKRKSIFRSFVFDGILLIALGLALAIWPDVALEIICVIIGAVIGVMGLIRCIIYFIVKDENSKASDLLLGILQICIGLAFIVARLFFIKSFFIIFGVMLIYGSLMLLIRAFLLRAVGGITFTTAIAFGLITLALGIIIFIQPAAFASFITVLEGISLVIEGLGMIVVLRKAKEEIDK